MEVYLLGSNLAALGLNLLALAGNVYVLCHALSRARTLKRTSEDFTRRLLSGRVFVVDADSGVAGRLVIVPAGRDMLRLYIEPRPEADPPAPPSLH